ncbi:MAG: ATP-binding cassette domain-containing protein [Pseudonocardiaceae bacterium]|nr:ATP-binding cassette domain-containing protein [Pseudonocardiaceae bacterium]
MSPPVVQLRGVGKRYGPLHVLRDVDLELGAGELVAVVGPSGSGKSTLLNLMGTLDRPSSGEVLLDGVGAGRLGDPALAALRAGWIGFVFQSFHLLDGLDAVGNVATGLLYSGLPGRERRRRAADLLRDLGLGDRLGHPPSALSGGERQRVAIARAVLARPALLLADEPTGNLDSAAGADVLALLTALRAEGTTVVVITHDREVAATMPRRVELRDGRVVADVAAGQR